MSESDNNMLIALDPATSTRACRDHLVKALACDMDNDDDDDDVKELTHQGHNMYADSLVASGTTNEVNQSAEHELLAVSSRRPE